MKLHSAVFYSNDLEKVKTFYLDILGLKLDYEHPQQFVSFWFSNEVRLGIKLKKEEREIAGAGTVFIEVENIEQLYEDMKQKQVVILKELVRQDWATNFSILDPDKNKIQFVQQKELA